MGVLRADCGGVSAQKESYNLAAIDMPNAILSCYSEYGWWLRLTIEGLLAFNGVDNPRRTILVGIDGVLYGVTMNGQ
jgi:hypothetical protein